jgi:hypothetical protein
MHSDKETGFYRICSSQPSIIEKTRFLGHSRVLKETGFLAESTHHNQEFSKKPGFWPPVRSHRNRVDLDAKSTQNSGHGSAVSLQTVK